MVEVRANNKFYIAKEECTRTHTRRALPFEKRNIFIVSTLQTDPSITGIRPHHEHSKIKILGPFRHLRITPPIYRIMNDATSESFTGKSSTSQYILRGPAQKEKVRRLDLLTF